MARTGGDAREDAGNAQAAGSLPAGPGFICLDSMVLIHFNRVGRLEVLCEWFGPLVFTAHAVLELELGAAVRRHPENKAILEADWLKPVPVDEVEDIKLVADLRQRWGSRDDGDRGEAEIIALCGRHGWTAIMDDDVGRTAAKEHGVARVYMLTAMIAAASHGLVTPEEAWRLHCSIEAERRRAILSAGDAHKPVFMACVSHFRRLTEKRGGPPWPEMLAVKGLDDLVVWVRKNT